MSKIIQLSEQVSNLIAAGEVVTGPESVIKELVENSIDAKSDDIEINLLDSGLESIEIIDNGSGMDETDAILAFNRHATSKIKTAYDLGSIQTLGFRGEALPSIASVSRLDLYTKTSDKTYGTHVVMQAGKLVEKETSACDTGTRIKVTKLFYNTPARLKYLKSSSAILASICTLVDKLALTNKNLKIKLTNNGNTLLQTDGSGNVLNMFYSVYGASISKLINHTEASSDGIKVDIYHSTPVISRSRKNDITLVVNGRLVQSNLVNNAVIEAYHSYLPMNRYPVCLIDIDIDPLLIDINVHPQKMEIKFSISDKIYSLIKDTLTLSLKNLTIIPEVSDEESEEVEQLSFADNLHFESDKEVIKPRLEEPIETKQEALSDIVIEQEEPQTEPVIEKVKEERKRRIPYFEYIGQLSGTYLLFQNEEGLYLVDQHAAQERINYEKYAKMLSTPNTSNIEMLVPYSITLTKEESIVLANNLDSLKQYGIIVEESGLNSFFVRTIPVWIKEDNPEIVIEKMIYFLLEQNCFDIGRIRDSLAKQMACKASIKANHYVTSYEANSLIEQLDKCDNPFNCPHGRPVFVKITNYEIEKCLRGLARMKKVIVIVGPTAIGKSHIGIEIAKRLNTSIISGDSVQVYKGLDIGSAKVTEEEMNGVKHYLIDELEPNEDYSVADFQKESRKLMEDIDIPLIVGGTGLYIKAAISNYGFDAPKRDSNFAESLKDKSNEELYDELLKVDLEQAKLIHPNNRKRVLRALEAAKSNNPLGEKRGKDEYLYDAYIVYLDAKREILYDRINKRVDLMFEEGLVEEVTDLYNKGIKPHAIGYQEFIPYFESNSSLDEVKEEIKLNTRHLAKRQTTFFKHQFVSNFYNVNLNDINQTIEEIYKDILEFLK